MRVLVAGLFVVCASAAFAAPVPKERAEAEKIVGTWKMTLDSGGNSDTNLELEFHQSGKMIIRQVFPGGQASVYEGTYRLSGTELPYEVKQGTRVKKETLTVKKLTADELIIVDPAGLKEEFVRVKKEAPQKFDPKKLVGTWEQVEPATLKFVIEYNADGSLRCSADNGDAIIKFTGTYKLDGSTLYTRAKARSSRVS